MENNLELNTWNKWLLNKWSSFAISVKESSKI
ncbi:hypothetical protein T03_16319 [Trichinella britovi]|uniref:Uncharacterized protein n=1 Tax=Trichinella britovi TaxID=45882 RepID=A0A0V0Z0D0_TRIBR|nr:hypothetical protein T03_16319 [Trichinella britovi]